jgi:hypothetical protein
LLSTTTRKTAHVVARSGTCSTNSRRSRAHSGDRSVRFSDDRWPRRNPTEGVGAAGFLFGFAIALRLSIDNIVEPIVLGEAARLHPVVVIISCVCGAILFGVVGLLIAVPMAVCIKVTLRQYYAEPIVDSLRGPGPGSATDALDQQDQAPEKQHGAADERVETGKINR